MRTLVLPTFERYTLREISISKIDRFLKAQAKVSYRRAKHSKVVLYLALGSALRYEAIPRNPVVALPGCVDRPRPPWQTKPRGVVGFEEFLGALLAALDGGVVTSIRGGVEQRHGLF
jgi:hypothetical protein